MPRKRNSVNELLSFEDFIQYCAGGGSVSNSGLRTKSPGWQFELTHISDNLFGQDARVRLSPEDAIRFLSRVDRDSFKLKDGSGVSKTCRNREIRCVQPLTGSYECTLTMVSRGASVFYQAFPV